MSGPKVNSGHGPHFGAEAGGIQRGLSLDARVGGPGYSPPQGRPPEDDRSSAQNPGRSGREGGTSSAQHSQGPGRSQSRGAGSDRGFQGSQGPGGPGRGHAYGHQIGVGNPHRGSASSAEDGPESGHTTQGSSDSGEYLAGRSDGSNLSAGTRSLLDHVANTVGQSTIRDFVDRTGQAGNNLVGGLLEGLGSEGNAAQVAIQARGLINQLSSALQLEKHFAQLERAVGSPAQRARDACLAFLSGPRAQAWDSAELLEDLRRGCFVPGWEEDFFSPTEAVLISMQLAALMRALEAIEALALGTIFEPDAKVIRALMAWLGINEATARMLLMPGPQLPGRAARFEIIAFLASLGGSLVDAKGKPLLEIDGKPLKLGELLWFSRLGGLFDATTFDQHATKFSPFTAAGFDSIFSLIGFDGRALPMPRFIAVQAQVSGSSEESLFGQVQFSEGWVRALIERLKDAAAPKRNALGEKLEEALLDGRFHLGLFKGRVADGRAVSESFDLSLVSGWAGPPVQASAFA